MQQQNVNTNTNTNLNTNVNKKILIGLPVSSRDWVLPHFLERVLSQDYDKKNIIIYFIANNITDNSLKILKNFKQENKDKYIDIIIEEINSKTFFQDERIASVRETFTYEWLGFLRNKLLKKCVELDCDYLLSCDSDILLRPDTITRLVSHKLHIVSSLIYNGYITEGIENAYLYPNILKEIAPRNYTHIVSQRTKYPEQNPIGKLLKVDFTGACILISKDVCKVARYTNPIAVTSHNQGEDEFFCLSARAYKYELFCDVSVFNLHCMNEDILKYFLDNELV